MLSVGTDGMGMDLRSVTDGMGMDLRYEDGELGSMSRVGLFGVWSISDRGCLLWGRGFAPRGVWSCVCGSGRVGVAILSGVRHVSHVQTCMHTPHIPIHIPRRPRREPGPPPRCVPGPTRSEVPRNTTDVRRFVS